MENIGAIKELGKITSLLNKRIDELERLFIRIDEPAADTSSNVVCSVTDTVCIKIIQFLLFIFVIFGAWVVKNIFFVSSN
jgi:RNA binding exosome subunit